MNIQIAETELLQILSADLEEASLISMPVESLTTDVSEKVLEQDTETMYLFTTPEGRLVFRSINGQYQVSSSVGDNTLAIFRSFCKIAEQYDLNYITIGLEPF